LVVGGWWLVVGGWWLVVGGWWLVVGGWWLVVGAESERSVGEIVKTVIPSEARDLLFGRREKADPSSLRSLGMTGEGRCAAADDTDCSVTRSTLRSFSTNHQPPTTNH
jgi:hypothetical protein